MIVPRVACGAAATHTESFDFAIITFNYVSCNNNVCMWQGFTTRGTDVVKALRTAQILYENVIWHPTDK